MSIVNENSKYNLEKENTGADRTVETRNFTELADTPNDYTNKAYFLSRINQTEDALEFIHPDTVGFPTGTKLSFPQAFAPAGWTQDTTLNDVMLRVVNTEGGGQGGTWDLTGVTTGGHTLTIAEMPSHNHSYVGRTWGGPNDLGAANNMDFASPLTTGATGGNASHSHPISSDNTWRPAYVDTIIATKN